MTVPVIDLFAGPGGLGEGFSSVTDDKGNRFFDIKLSIEKDESAHKTLRLRSFYRKFKPGEVPDLYYSYIKENNKRTQDKILEKIKATYPDEWQRAEDEAWHYELPFELEVKKRGGKEYTIGYSSKEIEERHKVIDERIEKSLAGVENFLLIGGPPCQAYSLAGRSRNKGILKSDHRVHLYKEYLRIIAKHSPAIFVMENVKGLLSARVGNEKVFDWIKRDLKNPDSVFKGLSSHRYKVFSFVHEPDKFDEDNFPVYYENTKFLIKAEKYKIPQRRHRVILLGIREDIRVDNFQTLNAKTEVNLEDVIGKLNPLRSGIGREIIGSNEKGNHIYLKINNTQSNWENALKASVEKLHVLFPNHEFKNLNGYPKSQGKNFVKCELDEEANPLYIEWFKDENLNGILNHETRTHLKEDLRRYLFSALWLKEKGNFPRLKDYPKWLLPKHKNVNEGKHVDRFRTQKPDQPATTVMSHISKDGHYFIHYDPKQCRSLTVREAARIQTFPDNYYFCGTRTQQYHQVGNAVPPYLARQLAEIVKRILIQ
jgi:DNA (cytosine-5)-methyltransferase 1